MNLSLTPACRPLPPGAAIAAAAAACVAASAVKAAAVSCAGRGATPAPADRSYVRRWLEAYRDGSRGPVSIQWANPNDQRIASHTLAVLEDCLEYRQPVVMEQVRHLARTGFPDVPVVHDASPGTVAHLLTGADGRRSVVINLHFFDALDVTPQERAALVKLVVAHELTHAAFQHDLLRSTLRGYAMEQASRELGPNASPEALEERAREVGDRLSVVAECEADTGAAQALTKAELRLAIRAFSKLPRGPCHDHQPLAARLAFFAAVADDPARPPPSPALSRSLDRALSQLPMSFASSSRAMPAPTRYASQTAAVPAAVLPQPAWPPAACHPAPIAPSPCPPATCTPSLLAMASSLAAPP